MTKITRRTRILSLLAKGEETFLRLLFLPFMLLLDPLPQRLQAALPSLFGFLLPIITIFFSNLTVGLFLAMAFWSMRLTLFEGKSARMPDRWLLATLIGFFAWAAVTVTWTLQPGDVWENYVQAFGMLLACAFTCRYLAVLPPDAIEKTFRGLVWGLPLGVAIYCLDWLAGEPLAERLASESFADDFVIGVYARAHVLHALLVWPVALYLWPRWGAKTLWLVAVLALCGVAIDSLGATLGLLLGLGLARIAWHQPRWGMWLAFVLMAISFVGAAPFAIHLRDWGLEEASWLPVTARWRVQIWAFTADRIFERPWWGWGFDAARHMPNFGVTSAFAQGAIIPNHPHNGPLQLWLELGLPGLAGGGLLIALLLHKLRQLSRTEAAIALGFYGTWLGIFLTSYGLWRARWVAAYCLALTLFVAARLALRARDCTIDGKAKIPSAKRIKGPGKIAPMDAIGDSSKATPTAQ